MRWERTLPFGGAPRLGLSSVRFLRGERELWGFTPSSLALISYWFANAPWPSSLPARPALAGTRSVASNASILYSQHVSTPCSDLAPSTPSDCCGRVPTLTSSSVVSIVLGGSTVRYLPIGAPLLPSAPCILVAWAVGGFLFPPPFQRPSFPGLS